MPIFDFICFLPRNLLWEVRVHDRRFICYCLYALLQWFKIDSRNGLLDSVDKSIWLYLDRKIWLMIRSFPHSSILMKVVWYVPLGIDFWRIARSLSRRYFCILIISWSSCWCEEIFRFSHLWVLIVILELPKILLFWRCWFRLSHC